MASASSSPRSRRRVEEAPGPGRDDLMSLPPDMLDNILARLPFEQLVRTSCLSRAWRRRWESVANLDIGFSPGSAAVPGSRVLWRCAAPVRSFTARVRMRHFHRAARWLSALARKRVERLALEFEDHQFRRSAAALGPALFSCRALAHLELYCCCHMPRAPRGFGGFPNLVTLVLNHVALPFSGGAAQLQHLISSAPRLAELWLNDVITTPFDSTAIETCAIRAPNLRILKLVMFFDNGCRVAEELELPLLEEAAISIDDLFGTPDFIDTFRRIASVKVLSFDADSNQFNENPLEGISWKFQNLRVATLTVNFGKLQSIMSIFSLLRCAPHIERVDIEVEKTKRKSDEVDEDFLNEELSDPESDDEIDVDVLNAEISDDLFANLKHVSLNGIKYFSNDICFIKFLLSKAGLLESFVVTFGYRRKTKSYVKALTELATCRKASPKAKLRVRLSNKPAPNPNDS